VEDDRLRPLRNGLVGGEKRCEERSAKGVLLPAVVEKVDAVASLGKRIWFVDRLNAPQGLDSPPEAG
jgi:hypothetical protein